MKKIFESLCILPFLSIQCSISVDNPNAITSSYNFKLSAEEQDFFRSMVMDIVTNGFGKMDINKVKSYYHPDPHLRFADADGPFHKGWNEYEIWLRKIFDGLVDKQSFLTRDVHTVRLSDSVALTTLIIDNKTRLLSGDIIDSAMRLTFVWKRTSSSWKIIHEHFSLWNGELANKLGYPDTERQAVELK